LNNESWNKGWSASAFSFFKTIVKGGLLLLLNVSGQGNSEYVQSHANRLGKLKRRFKQAILLTMLQLGKTY